MEYTVASVDRCVFPLNPFGSSCMKAAIVGIGYPPVAGFT
jgi:hypothetical protein